jgi:hypothetical protein
MIGGCLNLIVFLSLKTFRESSCAFYLTIVSLTNIGQLITGLLSRLMITGFNIDWTRTSRFYCKTRPFLLDLTALISAWCLCLATLDQYFATCTRVRWQQWNNIKLAHRLIIICSLICILEQIPTLIFYNHIISPTTNQTICTIINQNFIQFDRYFTVILLWFIFPLLITIVFGSLAYRNVQQITYRTNPLIRRELDKQLTVMVLVQVLVNLLAFLPNMAIFFLNMDDSLKANPTILTQINFSNAISQCLFYVYFAVSEVLCSVFLILCFFVFRVHFIFTSVYQKDFVDN